MGTEQDIGTNVFQCSDCSFKAELSKLLKHVEENHEQDFNFDKSDSSSESDENIIADRETDENIIIIDSESDDSYKKDRETDVNIIVDSESDDSDKGDRRTDENIIIVDSESDDSNKEESNKKKTEDEKPFISNCKDCQFNHYLHGELGNKKGKKFLKCFNCTYNLPNNVKEHKGIKYRQILPKPKGANDKFCPYCPYKTIYSLTLNDHVNRLHKEINEKEKKVEIKNPVYQCPLCTYNTLIKSSYERHSRKVHGNIKRPVKNPPTKRYRPTKLTLK